MNEKLRFEKELEFVQLLCNPEYIQHLKKDGCFLDPEFMKFLEYLNYWKEEPYCNFLMYPQCLEILNLLRNPKFIPLLENDNTYILLADQQYNIWNNSI